MKIFLIQFINNMSTYLNRDEISRILEIIKNGGCHPCTFTDALVKAEKIMRRELTAVDRVEKLKLELERAKRERDEVRKALDSILECPYVVDLATCPNGDASRIEEAKPWTAVIQISCAWTRYKQIERAAIDAARKGGI